jgi:hypothetical protein
VTTALQFLKEMDVITTRRQEATSTKNQPVRADADPAPKNAPKKERAKGNKMQTAKSQRRRPRM